MARNLKKFVNPQFNDTVPLDLLRRLLERHPTVLTAIGAAHFDQDPGAARSRVLEYLKGPDAFPEELVADLHRVAALGTREGLEVLLQQFRRCQLPVPGVRAGAADPKELALMALLAHPAVFDAAEHLLELMQTTGIAEFDGASEGVEAQVTEETQGAFRRMAASIFDAGLHGDYCKVEPYDDDGDIMLVVSHGTPITTTTVVREGAGHPVALQTIGQAILSYSSTAGRLKLAGVTRARQAALAETFAATLLARPGFFRGPDARNLYTLSPIERAWPDFRITHAYDRRIRSVGIVEAQVDRISRDLFGEIDKVEWSLVARDSQDCALARLRESRCGVEFESGNWRVGHVVLRVKIDAGRPSPASVTVKVKPQSSASFKRHRFEGQVMELLERNGFCCDRDADLTAVAAE